MHFRWERLREQQPPLALRAHLIRSRSGSGPLPPPPSSPALMAVPVIRTHSAPAASTTISISTLQGGGGSPALRHGRKRKRRSGGGAKEDCRPERTVRILCGRLSSEREYEEVEIEVPLAVYKSLQANTKAAAAATSAAEKEEGRPYGLLLRKVCRFFAWLG